MLTVLESLKLSTEFLEKKGIESPRLNAELLLSGILNCRRLDLYLKFDRPLAEEEVVKYRDWISRRGKFEPLQYITGSVEFYGLSFNVSRDVLIPRPETEILVETILNLYKDKSDLKILDIGTGSGNIPIVLAKNMSDVEITTIDVSENAIGIAKQNASLNEVESKIKFICSDVNHFNADADYFDIVVSNPPYVSIEEFFTLQKEIVDYEPQNAVTDSKDGYEFYKIIAERSKMFLKENGRIFFEVGKDQSDVVAQILTSNSFVNIRVNKDLSLIERVVIGELK